MKVIVTIFLAMLLTSCMKEQLPTPALSFLEAGYDINEGKLFVLMSFTCGSDQKFELKNLPASVEIYHEGDLYKSFDFSTNLLYAPNCLNTRRLQVGHNGPGDYDFHYYVDIEDNDFIKSKRIEMSTNFELK